MNVACRKECGGGDKNSGKLFVRGPVGKVEGQEICRENLDALLGWIAPDESEDSVAVFACSEANGSGSETVDSTLLDVSGHSLLLHISASTCKANAAQFFCAQALRR